ncbi:MAG: AsmA-like C-terminal region-containing protein [Bryobacteraceae bacterium]|nr:AsmA-like C-terminal region-containing protein [Bryobacteraceae bacterium]
MTRRRKQWLIGGIAAMVAITAVLLFIGARMSRRFEPYIRQQAVEYMEKRFESEAELRALSMEIPKLSPLRLLYTRGRGVLVTVRGEGIALRHRGRRDIAPMFEMDRFEFQVDLGRVFDKEKRIARVVLDGMKIHVPPKGERPALGRTEQSGAPAVVLEEILIRNGKLVILPRVKGRNPLQFDLHRVRLQPTGAGKAMKYEAELTNPKPPGAVKSRGTFGPWNAGDPGDTNLAGEYVFENADLGVFKAIAGTLRSTGSFRGSLSSFEARGTAQVPDFRLKRSGNRVPLSTEFEAVVDGTNGNTTLRPVRALLGSTRFTTSGAIIRHDGDRRRTISLDVNMPDGNLTDLLRLAMKGQPSMEGRIDLKTRIDVPPLSGKVIEKLILDGRFAIREGKFLKSSIQDKIDSLSRRGQGQPKSEEIDEVFSVMNGAFRMEDQAIEFRELAFGVPGADIRLAGGYDMDADKLDFRGDLRLKAKVSQTMSGWKRWALKPVDPFFSKKGAGTFLRIQVTGSSSSPQFGRERKK